MKYTALCIALICAFLIIPFASAALSAGNVALTLDEAVRRSNPLLTRSDSELDDSSELSYVTFNIPVTASGQAETINSVTPVLSGFSYDSFGNNLNSSLEFIVDTPLPMQVPAGQALTLTVRVLVPSNLDSIDSNYNDISHTVSANLLTTDGVKTPTLSFYAENELQLRKVDLTTVDGNTISCRVTQGDSSLDCNSDADKLPLGKDFTADFTIKNEFSRNARVDFSNIDATLDSDNSDVTPNDDSFSQDINAGDTQDFTTTFTVDNGVQDGDNAQVTIEASDTDDNGATHGFSHQFNIQFNAKNYELSTPTLTVAPSSVCPNENVIVTYGLQNLGTDSQPNVRPVLSNDALGLNKILPTANLNRVDDSGDTFHGTTSIVIPSTAAPGTYPVQLIVYYEDENSNDATSLQTATLTVQNCNNGVPVGTGSSTTGTGSTSTGTSSGNGNYNNGGSNTGNTGSQTGGNSGITVVQPGQGTGASGTNGQTVAATGTNVPVRAVVSESSNTPYLVGLGAAVLVLVVIVGLLIAAVIRK